MKSNPSLQKKVNSLPHAPGVYIFLNEKSKVLYVGKANDLNKRAGSYFIKGGDGRPQIPMLLEKVHDLNFLVTRNEREALILENNLIKQNRPPYNLYLKDDKTYRSIRLTTSQAFPGISIVRKYNPHDNNLYFGPYCDGEGIRTVFEQLQKIFQLRDCSHHMFKNRKRPCLKYQIKLCSAPCCNLISKEDYLKTVHNATGFLKGDNREVIRILTRQMKTLSEKMEFEKADEILQKIHSLKQLKDHPSHVSGFRKNSDALGLFQEKRAFLIQVLFIRNGKIISSDTRFFKNPMGTREELLRLFLEQFYSKPEMIPPEIWIPVIPDDHDLLQNILSEIRKAPCRLLLPRKGSKKKVIDMAMNNARIKMGMMKKSYSNRRSLIQDMKKILHLNNSPHHIECYDISHSSGRDTVGVKISFRDFKPCKRDYRKYHIKTVQGPDDYKSLYEVLSRRIRRGLEEGDLPDLILIDGGGGQLSVLNRVLTENRIRIDAAAIAKESHAKSSWDRIYLLNRKNVLKLPPQNKVLLKLMEIRNETHRFAIAFHKNKRERRIFNSK